MAKVIFYKGEAAKKAKAVGGLFFTTDKDGKVYKLYNDEGNPISDYDSIIDGLDGRLSTAESNITDHTSAIAGVDGKIGTGFDSTNTVKKAVDDLTEKVNAATAKAGVTSIGTAEGTTTALTVPTTTGAAKVKLAIDGTTIVDTDGSLAVGEITTGQVSGLASKFEETENKISTAKQEIDDKLGGSYSAKSTVADAIAAAANAGVTSAAVADGSHLSVNSATGAVTIDLDKAGLADDTAFTNKYATITAMNTAKKEAVDSSVVTVETDAEATGVAKRYVVKQNGKQVGVAIDIPKDLVVKSGSVITATADDVKADTSLKAGEKYIKLIISNAEETPIYIPVNGLVDVYTGGTAINIVDNAVSLKYLTTDKYLTVGTDGNLQTKGIDDAIATAKSAVSGTIAAEANKYVASVSLTDGKLTGETKALPTIASDDKATANTYVSGVGASFDTTTGNYKVNVTRTALPAGVNHVGDVVSVTAKNGVKNTGTATDPVFEAAVKSTAALKSDDVRNVGLDAEGNLVVDGGIDWHIL